MKHFFVSKMYTQIAVKLFYIRTFQLSLLNYTCDVTPNKWTLCPTQVKAIAQLLIHFNWTWVGLVRGDREYGRFAMDGLLRELQGSKVCVAYQEVIPLLYDHQRALEIIEVNIRA